MSGIAAGLENAMGSLVANQRFRAQMGLQAAEMGMQKQRTDAELQQQQFNQQRQKDSDALGALHDQAMSDFSDALPDYATVYGARYITDPAQRDAYVNSDQFKSANANLASHLQRINDNATQRQTIINRIVGGHVGQAQDDARSADLKQATGAADQITPNEYANSIVMRTGLPSSSFVAGANGQSDATQHVANIGQAIQSGNFDNLHDSASFFFPDIKGMIGHQLPGSGLIVTDANVYGAHPDPNDPNNVVLQPRLTLMDPRTKQTSTTDITQYGGHSLSMPISQAMDRVKTVAQYAQDAMSPENQQRLSQSQDVFSQLQSAFGRAGVDPRTLMPTPTEEKIENGGGTIVRLRNPFTGQVIREEQIQNLPKPLDPSEIGKNKAEAVKDYAAANKDNAIASAGSPQSVENTAHMIANGQIPMISGFAMKTPWGQSVVSRVSQLNPNYNAADFNTSKKALADFGSGKLGGSVRSFNVALKHLDTLGDAADALNNGNVQLFNKIGNAWASQTGGTAPTDFNAVKKIVGDEIVKAIVGSGGGVADREEAANTLSAANSPQQLQSVIGHYKELMNAQLGGLRQQYEQSTGRKDFNRFLSPESLAEAGGGSSGLSSVQPPTKNAAGWVLHTDANGNMAYVSPDGKRFEEVK
jgi:hypothetical protein